MPCNKNPSFVKRLLYLFVMFKNFSGVNFEIVLRTENESKFLLFTVLICPLPCNTFASSSFFSGHFSHLRSTVFEFNEMCNYKKI